MTTTQEPRRTLLEVFDIVGQRLYGSDWVGMQLQKVRQRVIASTEDMRKEIEPSQHAPDLPTEEVTLELHCEANAQEIPSPQQAMRMIAKGLGLSHWPDPTSDEYLEKYNAWCRRHGAETTLRDIISRYDVRSIWRDTLRGEQGDLSPVRWSPENTLFWITPASGLCGDSYRGPDSADCLIDRTDFDAAVEDALKTPADNAESAALPPDDTCLRFEAVLNNASDLKKEWKTHRRITSAMMAQGHCEGFSESSILKILGGRYPPAKKRGFDGLAKWALSKENKVPT